MHKDLHQKYVTKIPDNACVKMGLTELMATEIDDVISNHIIIDSCCLIYNIFNIISPTFYDQIVIAYFLYFLGASLDTTTFQTAKIVAVHLPK